MSSPENMAAKKLSQKLSQNAPEPDCFFQTGTAAAIYETLRDRGDHEQHDWLQLLWSTFKPHCPEVTHFLKDAMKNPHQRWWEMFLAWIFVEKKSQLHPVAQDGPDLAVGTKSGEVLVEAVAPLPGTGKDAAVRRYVTKNTYTLDRRAIRLRYGSVVYDKLKQLRSRLTSNVVSESDPYIVAVSGSAIEDSDAHKGIPEITNILFGLEGSGLSIPIDGGEPSPVALGEKTIRKHSSATDIDSGLFHIVEGDEFVYKGISGVLFSSRRIVDCRPKHVGDDFIFVPNPNATNPLPANLFGFGRSYTFESGHVRTHDFRIDQSRL